MKPTPTNAPANPTAQHLIFICDQSGAGKSTIAKAWAKAEDFGLLEEDSPQTEKPESQESPKRANTSSPTTSIKD